jgi:glutamyl-tRNA reductase
MQRLLVLGLNHTTAPLEVRERLAFNAAERDAAVSAMRQRFPQCETVLLSTCNRVELYAARDGGGGAHAGQPSVGDLVAFLASLRSVPAREFGPHTYHKAGREVVEHLFTVASSLDSMVLGETQILGQVRDAYDAARATRAAGPLLHPLFQRAIAVGKQVMRETALAEGRLSVASVAVDYARQIFEHFGDKTVLCIGAGKTTALVLQHFTALSPGRLLVCNRDPGKAQALAERFRGEAVPFERLSEWLVSADIVVSSTGATLPIVTRAQFEGLRRQRRGRPIFLIDIAVPRDIEPTVGEIDNVYLYNLDDLQQAVSATMSQRQGAIEAARKIVSRHVEEFSAWHRQREIGPIIDRLYKRYHRLAREELDRTFNKLPALSAGDKATLEDMARRIVNKMLHRPVQALRGPDGQAGAPGHLAYMHALEKLFELDPAEPAADAGPVGEPRMPQTPELAVDNPGPPGEEGPA